MPNVLLVAAGGGGDVIAAAMIAHALRLSPQDVVIATWAWERLMVDPVPGPRRPDDFQALGDYQGRSIEVVQGTRPPDGARSDLPRLRTELGQRIVLLDPLGGVQALSEQLSTLRGGLTGSRRVLLVDVGGDVLADGTEPGLKSPLADAIALAGCAALGNSVELLVAGPGLDGELTLPELDERLSAADARECLRLAPRTAEVFLPVLEWNPSEATALLTAAARGVEGIAEIRDSGTQVSLERSSTVVGSMSASRAARNALAWRLRETASFSEAEDVLKAAIGWTELDHERSKARRVRAGFSNRPAASDWLDGLATFEQAATARGSEFATFRRIAEALGIHEQFLDLRDALIATHPSKYAPPLWRLTG
jgi:hypothetical protein